MIGRLLVSIGLLLGGVQACTYSEVKIGSEAGFVIGRSNEFAAIPFSASKRTLDTHSLLAVYPRKTFSVPVRQNYLGKTVELPNELLYVGVTTTASPSKGKSSLDTTMMDGINEAGLTGSILLLASSDYEEPAARGAGSSVSYVHFLSWALGSFRMVDELEAALKNTTISGCWGLLPGICKVGQGFIPQGHWAMADSTGRSVVIEVVGKKVNIYENSAHTMTNDPPFPLHLANLAQYKTLNMGKVEPTKNNPTAQLLLNAGAPVGKNVGFNVFGLPGDSSPTSRFARAFFARAFSEANRKPKTIEDGMVLQQAVLNSVFIPYGMVTEVSKTHFDYTQINTLRVTTPSTKIFSIRTYKDMQWRSVNLADFADADKPMLTDLHSSINLKSLGESDFQS